MKIVNILFAISGVLAALLLLGVQFINIVFMRSRVEISIAVIVIGTLIIILNAHSIRIIKKLTQDL